jgi:ABC-type branched-subunit amino acid transport system substrate-binding protein
MEVFSDRMRRVGGFAMTATVALALVVPPSAGHATTSKAASPPKGGSRVGVSRKVIKLGMHMPTTGAVPVEDTAAEQAKDIFFRWLRAKGRKINGRRVRVILRNDNTNPSEAVNACKQLVTEEKVFALVGFTGADQMQACARYAASVRVPYISPGSTELRMNALPQTFATTMTWPAQGRLMADFMVTKLKARKRVSAIVRHNAPSSTGLNRSFVRAMRKRDAEVHSRAVPINANTADATAVVGELDALNVKNVLVHVTPTFYMQMLRAASQRNYRPQWTGIDWALQRQGTATSGCGFNGNLAGAKFFSPYPALPDRDRFDKKFDRAMSRFHPGTDGNEVHWGNWAQQKAIARLLRLPGRNLTRKRFVYFAERARKIKTGVGPRIDYRPNDHFGARQVHLNRVDCTAREWRTKKAFVSDFKRKKRN